MARLHIKFHDPAEIFAAEALKRAYDSGTVSGIVAAKFAIGEEAHLDDNGDPAGGRFIHIAYDTERGRALRNRFWLGDRVPGTPEEIEALVPD